MPYAAIAKEAVTIQCEEKRCNICGKHTNLTKDHVPPKFWHNKQMKRYSVSFGVGNPDMARREFPYKASNGIVFNTLCAECNNTVLGTRGDQDLQRFVAQYEKKCINLLAGKLPFSINVKANRVARSVVGHMLAAKRFYDEECNVDKVMRKYVLDTSLTPPTDYSLLYYPYPYPTIMIGRDLALISFPNAKYKVPGGMISVLASYPVSFIMTEKSVENEALGLDDLFTYCTDEVDEIVELKCKTITAFYPQTYEYKHPYWPINISDDERGIPGVLAGTSSEDVIFAVPSDS